MKKIISFLLMSLLFTFSCQDYLEEDIVSGVTYPYYETEKGIEDLVKSAYSGLRYRFNGEQSFTLHNYGVDEFTQAADGQNKYFDDYGAQLNPSSAAYIHDMWTEYYRMINTCNLGIEKLPGIVGLNIFVDEASKNLRIAELKFLRGFYYFQLVQQFGDIPITLEGSTEVRLEFPKSPIADVYRLIINDLRAAEAILPETQTEYGRATKGAAQHYLAKVYLTRGSAVQDQRGQQPTDMDSAAYWADLVINAGIYELEDNFADLWDFENQENSEVIFAAQFNNNEFLLNNSGNRTHLYYLMVYDNKPGMMRDLVNGRPWRRLMPTNYTLDLFDRKNDSRFYKSFKMTYYSNRADNIPTWTAENAPSPDLVGLPKFALGDTAVYLSLHTNVPAEEIAGKPYLWITRDNFSKQEFPALKKFIDPRRSSVNSEFGSRDGVYARLAETYLIAAEAYGRKGDYAKALTYINTLRSRAAYQEGEAKPLEFSTVEGGLYGDESSTEAVLLVTEAVFENDDPREQYPPSATTKEQRFIHFMLNERTRELLGEFTRWYDLVRTETFYERVQLFNPAAVNIQPFHKLRPIPQQHIDRVWRDGKPITDDNEKKALQNPGY